jgi:hypothetical protein
MRGALGRGAEALGEADEFGIGEVGGDQAIAVTLCLDAADIAEGAVGEQPATAAIREFDRALSARSPLPAECAALISPARCGRS